MLEEWMNQPLDKCILEETGLIYTMKHYKCFKVSIKNIKISTA